MMPVMTYSFIFREGSSVDRVAPQPCELKMDVSKAKIRF